jgi:hypothetical protein
MSGLAAFFSSAGFIPHGYCLLWRPDILALQVISDTVIAASYFSIPLAILAFVRARPDLQLEHKRVAILFGVFILGCGLTHVMGVVTLWRPYYVEDGLIKGFTALVSIITAVALWPMLPRLCWPFRRPASWPKPTPSCARRWRIWRPCVRAWKPRCAGAPRRCRRWPADSRSPPTAR